MIKPSKEKQFQSRYQTFRDDLSRRVQLNFADERDFIFKWLETYNTYIEDYYLSGRIHAFSNNDKNLISCPLLHSPRWNWRIHKNLISKLQQLDNSEIFQILQNMESIAQGHFSHLKRVNNDPDYIYYMTEFFYERDTLPKTNLLIMVGIEKVPTLERNKTKVERFDFNQFIMFVNLTTEHDKLTQSSVTSKYQDVLRDLSRSGFYVEPMDSKPKGNNQFLFQRVTLTTGSGKNQMTRRVIKSILSEDLDNPKDITYESVFFQYHTIRPEYQSIYKYSKELNRWGTTFSLRRIKVEEERNYLKVKNREAINQFSDYESAANLVDLLKNVTNLDIKLTDEEKKAIGEQGNAIVIGRSGTGKTTCALLRLFAFELVFRMRIRIKHQQYKKVLKDVLTQEPTGLQSVFVTTSPVLANKIQKYYKSFISNIKQEVKRKQTLKEQQESAEQVQDQYTSEQQKYIDEKIEKLSSSIQNDASIQTKMEKNEIQNMLESEIDDFKISERMTQKEVNLDAEDGTAYQADDDEFEDEQENEKFVLNEQETKFKSLKELKSNDFPAFFTVRQYLMLIEGSLLDPFFLRDKEGNIVNQDGQSSWNNYKSEKQKKLLKVSTQNNEEDNIKQFTKNNIEDFTFLANNHRKLEDDFKEILEVKPENRRFEVDYSYFENVFWPVVSLKFNTSTISCHTLWTEIYYTIKGSAYHQILQEDKYVNDESINNLLSKEQRQIVYNMYLSYEKWKVKQCGYDLMDLAIYIQNQMAAFNYDFPSIHLTFIDEVQDLPIKIVGIFKHINEHSHFFGGDSAQSIARGVGFRFQDLRTNEKIHQLTVNFRSHNKILDLSNSVISLLEGLFPTSIDILKKERSNITGLKPVILEEADINFLFTLFQGQQNKQGFIPIDFGCNQVIIVKDEESKAKLPPVLEHAICLTIKEAKGLEFDDVILFDFFSHSTSSIGQWENVKLLGFSQDSMSKYQFLETVTKHEGNKQVKDDEMDVQTFESTYGVEYDKENNIVTVNNIVTKNEKLKAFDRIGNSLLAQELKQLYTAITRPKNKLIIFDQNTLKRQPVQAFWSELNLVTSISSKDIEDAKVQEDLSDDLSKKEKQLKQEKNKIIQIMQQLIVTNTQEEWYDQGKKMFRHRYFEPAVKCFKKSGHLNHEKKAQAYFEATTFSGEIIKLDTELSLLKEGIGKYNSLTAGARIKVRDELLKKMKEQREKFVTTAETFLQINRKKQAAQCFFSAEKYEKAAEIYQELNQKKEAAEAFQLSKKNNIKAAGLYEQIQDFDQAITCLENANQWVMILHLIQRNSDKMNENTVKSLREKYISLAFQNIKTLIENQKNKDNNFRKPIQDKEGSDESILSFDSDFFENDEEIQEEEDEEDDNEEIMQNIEKIEEELGLTSQSNKIEESKSFISKEEKLKNLLKDKRKYKNDEMEVENEIEIDESFEPNISDVKNKFKCQLKKSKHNLKSEGVSIENVENNSQLNESVSVIQNPQLDQSIAKSISFIDKESNIDISEISFDNFSVLDPFDEILKNQINHSIQSILNSDYSILDSSQVDINQRGLLIQAKEGISISDEALICVLEVVSLIEPTILKLLLEFIETNKESEIVIIEKDMDIFEYKLQGIELVDLNKLDKTIIERVLDVLEKQLQPLIELQICNRYKMFENISKIIPFLSLKHSPLSLSNSQVLQNQFISQISSLKRRQRQQALIANTGLHTIFEQITPEYLNFKYLVGQNTENIKAKGESIFSKSCFEQLILQGYWKRILYLMDKKDALIVASVFSDFTSYKRIAQLPQTTSIIQTPLSSPDFTGLSSVIIDNQQAVELAKIYMEDFNCFAINKRSNNPLSLFKAEIPSYFKYHHSFWNNFLQKSDNNSNPSDSKVLQELLVDVMEILSNQNGNQSDLQIFDAVSSFNLVLLYHQQYQILQDITEKTRKLVVKVGEQIKEFVKNYNEITDKRKRKIVQAILSTYQVRMLPPQNNEIVSVLGKNQVVLHKSNQLLFSLLKNYKTINEKDIITYCDVEFENIRAPLNAVLLTIHRRIKPLLENIYRVASDANESIALIENSKTKTKKLQTPINLIQEEKTIYSENDYNDMYFKDETNSENMDFTQLKSNSITHKDEIFSKLGKQSQLLIYGLTEKYNELLFSSYPNQLISSLNFFLNEQILINLVINYEENQTIKLFIPEQEFASYQILSQNQHLLNKERPQNEDVLELNLNSYDNIEDIDEICQVILKSVKIASREQQLELFKMIFILLVNINDIDFQSLSDLLAALQLLDWTPEITKFLGGDPFYQKLINCTSVDEAKDFAYDFALTEEFETYFFRWEELSIINKPGKQGENQKRHEDDLNFFKNSLVIKEQKITTIQRFMKKNKDQLQYIYKMSKQFNDLTDHYSFTEEINDEKYSSQFRYILFSLEEAANSFDIIKQINKDILNIFYCQYFVTVELFNFIQVTLSKTTEMFEELSSRFSIIINTTIGSNKPFKKYRYYTDFLNLYEKILEFNKDFRQQLNHQLIKINGTPVVKKKVESIDLKLNPTEDKVNQLMEKQKKQRKQQKAELRKDLKSSVPSKLMNFFDY